MGIRKTLISMLNEFRDNTLVIENSDDLKLAAVKDGVLIVCAIWSSTSLSNCILTLSLLYEKGYLGEIIVIDNDVMSTDFQLEMLGQINHGWGEIFKIHNGEIVNKYLHKDSFSNFKNEFD